MLPTSNSDFWAMLDALVSSSEIVIDRPRASRHPQYPDIIYPLDYGYLSGTSAMDGEGIDLFLGSLPAEGVQGVVVTVDMWKRDSEIKLLLGCTESEIQTVVSFLNEKNVMAGMLIRRELEK